MVTYEEAVRLIEAFPEVSETLKWGKRHWLVAGGKGFAWERPFTKADIKRFGDQRIPEQPVFAVRLADMNEKQALLAENRPGHFDIEHFKGFPALLVELPQVSAEVFEETLLDGWLACAPTKLADDYMKTREP